MYTRYILKCIGIFPTTYLVIYITAIHCLFTIITTARVIGWPYMTFNMCNLKWYDCLPRLQPNWAIDKIGDLWAVQYCMAMGSVQDLPQFY